jgi:hypothetical protein
MGCAGRRLQAFPCRSLEHLLVQLLKKLPLDMLLLSLQYGVFMCRSRIEAHRIFMSVALGQSGADRRDSFKS